MSEGLRREMDKEEEPSWECLSRSLVSRAVTPHHQALLRSRRMLPTAVTQPCWQGTFLTSSHSDRWMVTPHPRIPRSVTLNFGLCLSQGRGIFLLEQSLTETQRVPEARL